MRGHDRDVLDLGQASRSVAHEALTKRDRFLLVRHRGPDRDGSLVGLVVTKWRDVRVLDIEDADVRAGTGAVRSFEGDAASTAARRRWLLWIWMRVIKKVLL